MAYTNAYQWQQGGNFPRQATAYNNRYDRPYVSDTNNYNYSRYDKYDNPAYDDHRYNYEKRVPERDVSTIDVEDSTAVQYDPPGVTRVVETRKWSWCQTVWSVVNLIFCCPLCGWIAMMCAIHAYTDHKAKDFERSRYKLKWALAFNIIAVVLALLLWTVIVVVVYFAFRATFDTIFQLQASA